MYAKRSPRAEFINPLDLVPVLGTISRARRITKGTLRTYGWLKRKRVEPVRRIALSGMVGAKQMLRAQRIFPYGAALNSVHAGGRAAVRAGRAGKGAKGSAKAFRSASGGALAASKSGLTRAVQPAISYRKGFGRAYKILGYSDPLPNVPNRVLASNAVGTRLAMKESRGGTKFYGLDRRGRRIVRSIQNKGRKLKRRFTRKS